MILDDTCYFLSLESRPDALLTAAALRSPTAQALLSSLTFTDAKRPITKRVLKRVDWAAVIRYTDPEMLLREAARIAGPSAETPSASDIDDLLLRLDDGRLALAGA